ncbi:MAG: hypothetical protein J5850_03890 [Clostridia bacterium]|nr:hypothetical protein [Clostridia bacterium]
MASKETERFDMTKKPVKCRWFLKPIAWGLSFPNVIKHKTKITKTGVKGLKPPYILLGNHNAFFDMSVSAAATFPYFGNYVVAIDGFIGREGLLRNIGCICKRKFTNDILLIRQLQHVIDLKGIVAIYPEARYSLCGTTAPIPESLGKMCKLMNVPVVTLICHGYHINHPFWNTRHERGVKPTEAEMKLLLSEEDVKRLSADEINELIVKEFQYDDFRWQKEKQIKVSCNDRAVGLEKILYQCPHCGKEYGMESSGVTLRCKECGKEWTMTEYGELEANDGNTEFSHIPDWYEWERDNVKKEVAEGKYNTGELPVTVESLPNSKGFISLGKGIMVHDMNGFRVRVTSDDGEVNMMEKSVPDLYSCHIEYEYLFKHGDCVDLNTLDDTWYVYPYDCKFSVTKMALATEELYYDYRRKSGRPCKPGLA